ncbi:MAG TPA: hypothetical protein VHP11_03515, partial [Tepidisphaeraceae bacterium]|nr:hypothetical protein [Tepidisphaeraceae bacterium]
PITESLPELRTLPDWEHPDSQHSALRRFGRTTLNVIFYPSSFYRNLSTRVGRRASRRFARLHVLITSLLLGLAGFLQFQWLVSPGYLANSVIGTLAWTALFSLLTYGSLATTTHLAARLTAWEARFRGYRLPYPVVLRGLDYHTPHYLPVALGALGTVAGYQTLLATGIWSEASAPTYLYVLCAEVVLSAGYLFWTYWLAMRNMLFANR